MYNCINQDERAAPEAAVMADEKWNRIILSYIFDNERIIMTRLSSDWGKILTIGVYTASDGNLEETGQFC